MTTAIIAKKLQMGQIFSADSVTSVTWVAVSPSENVGVSAGDMVKVVGVTKGRGFQGVVKRHGFHGGPKTHGQKNRHRAPGSLGPTGPQRVIKGRRMAGRMGGDQKTIKNVKVVEWNAESGLLALKGSLPGSRGSSIKIYTA